MFEWPSKRSAYEVTVFMPVSNLIVYPTIREKTEFIGRVARAAAIFKVSNLVLVNEGGVENLDLFATVLNYLLIPPYLRKKLVPLTKELRYAGALPPLNIPTHNPRNERPKVNDVREGVIRIAFGRKGKAFFGHGRDCLLISNRELSPGERVLLRITSVNPLKCVEEDPYRTEIYLGYKVYSTDVSALPQTLRKVCRGCVKILTSKAGEPFTRREAKKLLKEVKTSNCLALFFGNYGKDFNELIPKELFKSVGVAHVYNFINKQGVYSVRTDEALFSVLSTLNFALNP